MTTLDMFAAQETRRALPSGWRWARLGEVCFQDRQIISPDSPLTARPYLSLEHIESNTGRILRQPTESLEDEGQSTTFAFDSRHVLYGKLRPYLNKVALPDFAGRCTTEAIPLLPAEHIDRRFLAWVLRRKETVDAAMREKTGARMPRADMAELLSLEIPLPPLAEQRRIAAILAEQLAAVADARAAAVVRLEAAQALPAAYLRAVFESDEARGWERQELRSLCLNDGQYGTSSPATVEPIGIPVLRMGNLQNGRICWDDLKYIVLPKDEEIKYLLRVGDLIFNRTNSAELVGKTAIFDTRRDAIFASYLIRFQLDPSLVNPFFVSLYINSSQGRAFIREHMARAIGQVNISASTMHRMPIPVPTLRNQEHIAAILTNQFDVVEQTCIALQAQLAAIDALPAALLRRAFNGEL